MCVFVRLEIAPQNPSVGPLRYEKCSHPETRHKHVRETNTAKAKEHEEVEREKKQKKEERWWNFTIVYLYYP